MNNKKLIRLTEADLHRIVNESVNKVLNEIGDTQRGQYMMGRAAYRSRFKKGDEDIYKRLANSASQQNGGNYDIWHQGQEDQSGLEDAKAGWKTDGVFTHQVYDDEREKNLQNWKNKVNRNNKYYNLRKM